jgi:hypothetical protein
MCPVIAFLGRDSGRVVELPGGGLSSENKQTMIKSIQALVLYSVPASSNAFGRCASSFLFLFWLSLSADVHAQPGNDAFGNRFALAGSTTNISASLRAATLEPGEPSGLESSILGSVDDQGFEGERTYSTYADSGLTSAWWSWRAPSHGRLVISNRNPKTRFSSYSGSRLPELARVEGATDPFPVDSWTFPVVRDVEYQIVVRDQGQGEQVALSLIFVPLSESRTAGIIAGTGRAYCSDFDYSGAATLYASLEGKVEAPVLISGQGYLSDGRVLADGTFSGMSTTITSLSRGKVTLNYQGRIIGKTFTAQAQSLEIFGTINGTYYSYPIITEHPQDATNTPASLRVVASANSTLSYQWYQRSQKNIQWDKISSATNSTFVVTSVPTADLDFYAVRVFLPIDLDRFGSRDPGVVSNPVRVGGSIIVPVAPGITTQPRTQAVTAGSAVSFSVTASGTAPLSFQWSKDGKSMSGATNATYSIAAVQAVDAGSYTVIISNPGGSVTSASANLTVNAPVNAGSFRGDLNSDGLADLLFQDTGGYLAAWMMNGANLISGALLQPNNPGDAAYRVVSSGDFNQDGKEDIIFQHTDGTLAVWFMNGTRLASASLLTPSNPGDRNWRVVGVGDLNSDGKSDLVFQHADGTLAGWFMDGIKLSAGAVFTPKSTGDAQWRAAGLGDLNADGKPDLVFQHNDGSLAVWLLNGTTLTQALLVSPPSPGAGWRLVSVADRNGDGKADLLFQHTNLDLAVWFMDGAKLTAARLLNPSNSGGTWKVVGPR